MSKLEAAVSLDVLDGAEAAYMTCRLSKAWRLRVLILNRRRLTSHMLKIHVARNLTTISSSLLLSRQMPVTQLLLLLLLLLCLVLLNLVHGSICMLYLPPCRALGVCACIHAVCRPSGECPARFLR